MDGSAHTNTARGPRLQVVFPPHVLIGSRRARPATPPPTAPCPATPRSRRRGELVGSSQEAARARSHTHTLTRLGRTADRDEISQLLLNTPRVITKHTHSQSASRSQWHAPPGCVHQQAYLSVCFQRLVAVKGETHACRRVPAPLARTTTATTSRGYARVGRAEQPRAGVAA